VALLTAGPGHCNAVSALYVALMAESPVVLLSGHCPRAQIGLGAFQEMDQVAVARPVTKAAWLAEDPGRLGEDLAAALRLACTGRPGPIHLSLPADVLEAKIQDSRFKTLNFESFNLEFSNPLVDDAQIREILDLLAGAERPLILTGPAMSRPPRRAGVERLSEATGVPALPMESPRGADDPGLRAATNALSGADMVLLMGKKLDFSLRFGRPPFFAESCRFIQIDADRGQLREGERIALAIHGDPSDIVQRMAVEARGRRWRCGPWREEVAAMRRATPLEWELLRRSSRQPVHPLRVCEALQPFLNDGAILISDGGEFGQWMQAGLEAERRLINGPSGAIGSALPMGLAAKLTHPQRQVFVVLGDGTFGYHALELDTALRYRLPVVAVVGNDARWNAEHQLQVQNYGPERAVGCDLLPSRYDRVAEALGGHGEFVQRPDDLAPALRRAAASGLPACVNVLIEGAAAPTFR
jgi:acetolactate synthase-1/2/3 large subunit